MVRKMSDTMAHRGPDDSGAYSDKGIALDRPQQRPGGTGWQPIRNESGTIWAVVDGEIYNQQELHDELKLHRFILLRHRGHRASVRG